MTMLFTGLVLGGLIVWFLRPENTGATTEAVLPFGKPQRIDSAHLVRAMKK